MTQDEFEKLPDITPQFGQREDVINGKICVYPVQTGFDGALHQKADDGVIADQKTGLFWVVGWHLGARVKRRIAW